MPNREDQPERRCRPCELGWGAIGVVAGTLILLMAVDLITDGRITRLATRGAGLAPVVPLKKESHDDAAG